jgi:succinate-semialdehyde dehydrogenase/glutarate-semialdehyde dehydrogenase
MTPLLALVDQSSQRHKRAMQVADQIDSGMIFINEPTTTQPDLPFGGTKGSGYGRELSELEFMNL